VGDSFVVVGGGNGVATPANTLYYSYDGKHFTPTGNSVLTRGVNQIAYDGRMWVACGGPNGTNNLAYSNDGIQWQPSANGTAIFGAGATIATIATNGKMWVAGATQSTPPLAYSYDGINWTAAGTGSVTNTAGVVWTGDMWVCSCTNAGGNCVGYSYDGVQWFSTNQVVVNLGKVATNGRGTSVAISATRGNPTRFYYTTNGISWAATSGTTNILIADVYCIASNGTYFVAAGTDGAIPTEGILAYSRDGINWLQASIPGVGSGLLTGYIASVTWTGNAWVAVSTSTTGGANVLYCTTNPPDTWYVSYSGNVEEPYAICSRKLIPGIDTPQPQDYSTAASTWTMSGGGDVTWTYSGGNTGYITTSARVIAIPNNYDFAYGNGGYFDIGPFSSQGLGAWQAMYYAPPRGSTTTYNSAYLRIVDYPTNNSSGFSPVQKHWLFICSVNGDNWTLKWNPSLTTIAPSSTISPQIPNTAKAWSYALYNDTRTIWGKASGDFIGTAYNWNTITYGGRALANFQAAGAQPAPNAAFVLPYTGLYLHTVTANTGQLSGSGGAVTLVTWSDPSRSVYNGSTLSWPIGPDIRADNASVAQYRTVSIVASGQAGWSHVWANADSPQNDQYQYQWSTWSIVYLGA
jgi:hypothetical protein